MTAANRSLRRRARDLRRRPVPSGLRTAADRVRRDVIGIVAAQEGLVTLPQLAPSVGERAARRGLGAMVALEELVPVVTGVWGHAATDAVDGSPDVQAMAAWVMLEPETPAWRRAARVRDTREPVAVIGGGAAYRRWGFAGTLWPSEILLAEGREPTTQVSDVSYRHATVEHDDIVWFGSFPYVSAERALVGRLTFDDDVDDVAADLADAMHRLGPIDTRRIHRHLRAASEAGLLLEDADAAFVALVRQAERWQVRSVPASGAGWVHNRAAVDALYARYRNESELRALRRAWDGVIDDARGLSDDDDDR